MCLFVINLSNNKCLEELISAVNLFHVDWGFSVVKLFMLTIFLILWYACSLRILVPYVPYSFVHGNSQHSVSHVCRFQKILLKFKSSTGFPHKVHRMIIICLAWLTQKMESLKKKKVKQPHAALLSVGNRIPGHGGNYRWHKYAMWNTSLSTLEVQVRTCSHYM